MELISITQNNLQKIVGTAAQAIQAGKVLITPTDTVYGIIANALDEKAIERVYAIKKTRFAQTIANICKKYCNGKKICGYFAFSRKIIRRILAWKITAILKKRII